jgi:hypothetical protein
MTGYHNLCGDSGRAMAQALSAELGVRVGWSLPGFVVPHPGGGSTYVSSPSAVRAMLAGPRRWLHAAPRDDH